MAWSSFTENLGEPDTIHSVNIVLIFCTETPYDPVRRSFRSCASPPSSRGACSETKAALDSTREMSSDCRPAGHGETKREGATISSDYPTLAAYTVCAI